MLFLRSFELRPNEELRRVQCQDNSEIIRNRISSKFDLRKVVDNATDQVLQNVQSPLKYRTYNKSPKRSMKRVDQQTENTRVC